MAMTILIAIVELRTVFLSLSALAGSTAFPGSDLDFAAGVAVAGHR